MPSLLRPRRTLRARSGARGARAGATRIGVLGDLALDVIVAPARPPERGTDVPGRVSFVQGGSAANTARWLGRLGAQTTLICAVGRDRVGRALIEAVRSDRVTVRATRVAGTGTGRIAVILGPDGERTFVTQRGAAQLLRSADIKRPWFDGMHLLHLPIYSLLGEPLSAAARQALGFARDEGAMVSVDLSSIGPLMADGPAAAQSLVESVRANVLFATGAEADALAGRGRPDRLLEYAAIAVVKRGSKGATVLAREGAEQLRFEVATAPLPASDTTGAGDAFDAGFIVGWFAAQALGHSLPASLHRATVAGHRAAARQLQTPRPELVLR